MDGSSAVLGVRLILRARCERVLVWVLLRVCLIYENLRFCEPCARCWIRKYESLGFPSI